MKKVCLMDMDGTLTSPRKKMKKRTLEDLIKLKDKFDFGIVSGSDFGYINEQCEDLLRSEKIDVEIFPCNGTKIKKSNSAASAQHGSSQNGG